MSDQCQTDCDSVRTVFQLWSLTVTEVTGESFLWSDRRYNGAPWATRLHVRFPSRVIVPRAPVPSTSAAHVKDFRIFRGSRAPPIIGYPRTTGPSHDALLLCPPRATASALRATRSDQVLCEHDDCAGYTDRQWSTNDNGGDPRPWPKDHIAPSTRSSRHARRRDNDDSRSHDNVGEAA